MVKCIACSSSVFNEVVKEYECGLPVTLDYLCPNVADFEDSQFEDAMDEILSCVEDVE